MNASNYNNSDLTFIKMSDILLFKHFAQIRTCHAPVVHTKINQIT